MFNIIFKHPVAFIYTIQSLMQPEIFPYSTTKCFGRIGPSSGENFQIELKTVYFVYEVEGSNVP
jgi:hypothetical protein